MNLGEEYRWNVRQLTYGYTGPFLDYFGQRGVVEIDKAVAIMNELPEADQMNPDDYPLTSQRVNNRAAALNLADLRSTTLSVLVTEMGLDSPERYVFTLRNRWISPTPVGPTNYYVIKRNFDPITWQPSSYINGVLWTYSAVADGPTTSITLNQPVDPLALQGLLNEPVAGGVFTSPLIGG
jgi:hypothetical protein